MYGREEEADSLIDTLCADKDPILRFSGMHTIAMAYIGTANNRALLKLLHFAVSDVNDGMLSSPARKCLWGGGWKGASMWLQRCRRAAVGGYVAGLSAVPRPAPVPANGVATDRCVGQSGLDVMQMTWLFTRF
jgi:hypothetical protein